MVIDKFKKRGNQNIRRPENKSDIPVGKWVKCEKCGEILYREDLHKNFSVCMNCGHHFRLSSRRRIWQTLDENSFIPFEINVKTVNPLKMEDYMEKMKTLQEILQMDDAVVCGTGTIKSEKVVICVMEGNFLMGSMGSVVGEKITYSIEQAIALKLPLIIFSVSGGARMQEGIISLMQMAKTSSAIAKLNEAGGLFISVLTDPTYGGVTASFASLGDVILAEPDSRVGFAGKRVIKQTIGEELPEGFQTSEFLLEHGFVDKIVERKDMKEVLYKILMFHKG